MYELFYIIFKFNHTYTLNTHTEAKTNYEKISLKLEFQLFIFSKITIHSINVIKA